jgi:hypothetical protein
MSLDKKKKDLDYLTDDSMKHFVDSIDFEYAFYKHIADTTEFEIIPIPCNDGTFLTEVEKQSIIAVAKASDKKILYRIVLGQIAVIFEEHGKLVGMCPEYNVHGFAC